MAPRFPDPGRLLAHGPSMRLVDEILEMSEEALKCRARVPSGSPLASESASPCVVGVEMAAQAVAMHRSLTDGAGRPPRQGYLVRVRDTRLHSAQLPVDETLRVSVRLQAAAPPLFLYDVTVDDGTVEYLSGTIGIYAEGPTDPDS